MDQKEGGRKSLMGKNKSLEPVSLSCETQTL